MNILGRIAVIGLVVAGAVLAAGDPITLLSFVSYAAVGVFIAIRRPDNVIGWLLIGLAFGFIGTSAVPGVDVAALQRGDASMRDDLIALLGGCAATATFFGFLALTILFPNGRLPERDGRRTSIVLLALGIVDLVLTAIAPIILVTLPDGGNTVGVPNPFAVLPALPLWSVLPVDTVLFPAIIVLLAIGVVRIVLRYRRAVDVERLQLRWLVASVVFVLTGLVFGLATFAIVGDDAGGGAWLVVAVAYPTIPLAVGVAVMRYRLLEIDRIISRTIGWALVTGILLVTFGGAVIALQAALSGFTQGQTFAVAGSTLVAFALFQPLRRRVQAVVDRRFDRGRYDGERMATAFAARLRDQIDLTELEADVVDRRREMEGYIPLSHERASRTRAWDTLEKAYRESLLISGHVLGRVKGRSRRQSGSALRHENLGTPPLRNDFRTRDPQHEGRDE